MDWVEESKRLFKAIKPKHFTNFSHCEECAEHDETLILADIETIGLDELGNPGWDPICFCSEEGKKYYMPSFIRLSLDSIYNDFYFAQFLFHLEYDGENNKLLQSCSKNQRAFIASFVKYMIESFPVEIEKNICTDEVFRVYHLWHDT